MTVITRNENLGLRPLLRFSPQFLNTDDNQPDLVLKSNIQKLVSTFTLELQELEDTLIELMYSLCVFDFTDPSDPNNVIARTEGYGLDIIASIVGAKPRQGMTDDQYRAEIALQIAINTSKGNITDVVAALKKITQGSIIEWTDDFPAAINFITNGNFAGQEVLDQITQILSAAVGFTIAYRDDSVGVFEFSDKLVNCTHQIPVSVTNSNTAVTLLDGDINVTAGTTLNFGYNTGVTYTVSSRTGNALVISPAYAGSTSSAEYALIKLGAQLSYHPDKYTWKAWADLYSNMSMDASVTNGSATVTLSATDVALITTGDVVFFEYDITDTYVATVASATTITLDSVYAGDTTTSASMFVQGVNTAAITDGSDTVTIDSSYNSLMFEGDYCYFNNDSSNAYKITDITGGTITLAEDYKGTTDPYAAMFVTRGNKTLAGTCDITNASSTVVINTPADRPKVMVGDTLFFDGSVIGYTVATKTGTGCTITPVYAGTTNATASCRVVPHCGAFLDILSF